MHQEKRFSIQELASLSDSTFEGNPEHLIYGVEGLDSATAEDASFLANPRYLEQMKRSGAGVIILSPESEREAGKNYLLTDQPSRVFQLISELFYDPKRSVSGFAGEVHPSAVIHESAEIGENVSIGPNVTIDQGVKIGPGSVISSNVSVGPFAEIGTECTLMNNVVIRQECILGDRVIIQPGAIIGSCGFGYTVDATGNHQKLNQIGNVIIEDDVEVGANCCIDRGRFKATRIARNTKIDNLVQIGHNVQLGPHNIVVAQTGIAGSSKTGKYVMMGGQVGIVGHVTLGDHVQIATRGGVSKSISKPGAYRGSPAIPIRDYHEEKAYQRKIKGYAKRLKELEQKLAALESNLTPA
ncbi:MAG: UDP-3-O-acylglucosamine N-acyltransferase [Chlamydiia bacterium]|nr:UDP-3-O-acylglucosamine N-acyltransferase [Chlamydiia bacterium]